MDYRSLGRSGFKVAPMALGTFNFGGPTDEETSIRIMLRALEAGINLFDIANSYNEGRSETFAGEAIRQWGRRDDVVVATKVHFPVGSGPNDSGNSRHHIIRECDRSLARMGLDHIDLLQLHRPDFSVPAEETFRALDDLVTSGKVRYIGTSSFPAWKLMEAVALTDRRGWVRPVVEQPPYNLLDRRVENEMVPLCLAHGLSLVPYAPLAQGVLAGRYTSKDNLPKDSRAVTRGGVYSDRVTNSGIAIGAEVARLAAETGASAGQLAMAWVRDQPAVAAPLFGPRTMEQLEHMLPVLDMAFPPDLLAKFDALVPPGSAVTNFHNGARWMKQVLDVPLPTRAEE
ncbi:aldo/keto reductase [Mameliella alba]|uniref:aldo/keto reductase n=1 Tax=Mameliella alba TaxID=561184 RepID=UPI000B52EEBB|nr:aldo/keto reductase [Mameliella alba]OWV46242.1 aldo/keto reductase [Mameliella alba]GGF74762.1 oxidoreductase [Mameliella alba]